MVSSHRGVGEADPAASRGASAAALLPEERRSMPDVNMPKLSDTMEEGTIVEWKKKSGDEVKTGEVLAEVESDKATFDLEAESDGVLQILVEQGVPAKIGAPIAKIGEGGGQGSGPCLSKGQGPRGPDRKRGGDGGGHPAPYSRPAPPAAPRSAPRRPGRRGDRALAHAGHDRAPHGGSQVDRARVSGHGRSARRPRGQPAPAAEGLSPGRGEGDDDRLSRPRLRPRTAKVPRGQQLMGRQQVSAQALDQHRTRRRAESRDGSAGAGGP